ncbi:MAG TPA: DUF2945 domain-containing protein [Verrucomicrobiae bacterium]|nr:DUF2945 domain-containing protein [Verrucomicrobiae bacterium]
MRARSIKAGDKVVWSTSRGKTTGLVAKKLTRSTHIKKHRVGASGKNPEFLVKSLKSGKKAAHKPEALRKV